MRISDWSSDVCSSDLVARDPRRGLLSQRLGSLRLGDEAGFDHGLQHQARALVGAFRIARRVEPRGCLEQAGKERRLVKRDARCRLAEVVARRCIDTISAGAEVDPVEVRSEENTSELQSLKRISYA